MEKFKPTWLAKFWNDFLVLFWGCFAILLFYLQSWLCQGHIILLWMDEFCKVPGNKTSVIKHVQSLWGTDWNQSGLFGSERMNSQTNEHNLLLLLFLKGHLIQIIYFSCKLLVLQIYCHSYTSPHFHIVLRDAKSCLAGYTHSWKWWTVDPKGSSCFLFEWNFISKYLK